MKDSNRSQVKTRQPMWGVFTWGNNHTAIKCWQRLCF